LLLLFQQVEIITWFQGVLPEESFLKNKSKLRYIVLSIIEYIGLKLSDKQVFVSSSMKTHYEKKYKFSLREENYTIIPCYSDLEISTMSEKIINSFVYVGGMAVWQCFDEIVKIYKDRFSNLSNSLLYVVTMEQEVAREYLKKAGVTNYKVMSFNNRLEMSNFLSKMEFGFLIRKDIAVNNVASPIKFAEYLSCGINVIMNDSVKHFSNMLEKHKIGNVISKENSQFTLVRADKKDILDTYRKYFDENTAVENYHRLILG
jgi:hypothetical protein